MTLRTITPAADIPETVSLEEARRHLRVEHPEDDALIMTLIGAAVDRAEAHVQRRFTPRLMEWAPLPITSGCGWSLRLPVAPVTPSDVQSVRYVPDGQTALVDWPATEYAVLSSGHTVLIRPRTSGVWPFMESDAPEPLVLRFNCGYAQPPDPVKAAILLMVGDLYRFRETVVVGASVNSISMPASVEMLLRAEAWT